MKKLLLTLLVGLLAFASFAVAAPVETTDGFVCPVFNQNSAVGMKNPNAVQIGGGDFTVIGPQLTVPLHATNGDGAGTPPGPHSVPGDTDYTAIWAG
jgi:hypothetical protein